LQVEDSLTAVAYDMDVGGTVVVRINNDPEAIESE